MGFGRGFEDHATAVKFADDLSRFGPDMDTADHEEVFATIDTHPTAAWVRFIVHGPFMPYRTWRQEQGA
jgi:hypothetical protein